MATAAGVILAAAILIVQRTFPHWPIRLHETMISTSHGEKSGDILLDDGSSVLRILEVDEIVELDPALGLSSAVNREDFQDERSCSHDQDFEIRHAMVTMITPGLPPNVFKVNQGSAEKGFAAVYNSISGVCGDVYERMIHQVSLVDATIVTPSQDGKVPMTSTTWNVLLTCVGCGHVDNPLFSSLVASSDEYYQPRKHKRSHYDSQGNLRKKHSKELTSEAGARAFLQKYMDFFQVLLALLDPEATQNDSPFAESEQSGKTTESDESLESLESTDTDAPPLATSLTASSMEISEAQSSSSSSSSISSSSEEMSSDPNDSDVASPLTTLSTLMPSASPTNTHAATKQAPTDSGTDAQTTVGEGSGIFLSDAPSSHLSWNISHTPTDQPNTLSSGPPSSIPSTSPSIIPSLAPSLAPSISPSEMPTQTPSQSPSQLPSQTPSLAPSGNPSMAPSVDDDILQVYVLLGQSNMLGMGHVGSADGGDGTLHYAVRQRGLYPFLLDSADDWTASPNVRITHVIDAPGGEFKVLRNEFMAIHDHDNIGPEHGIGQFLEQQKQTQDTVNDIQKRKPILLLKSCVGNRSLGWDFLPPGSQRYIFNDMMHAGYKDSPASWPKDEPKPPPDAWYAGKQYDSDLSHVKSVLADIATYYPGTKKYKIAGFFWWQGDKDTRTEAYGAKYESNLVRLISQLRLDFDAPDAKFVLATLGQTAIDDMELSTETEHAILKAMLDVDGKVGKYPEFSGNVATVYANPLSKGGTSSGHYQGNAETYMNVGLAMGQAMVDLESGGD